MRTSLFVGLLAGLALSAAGCASTSQTLVPPSNSTTTPVAIDAKAGVMLWQVRNLPEFSASTTIRIVQIHDRVNGEVFDPVNKRAFNVYGTATSSDYYLDMSDERNNELGMLYVSSTQAGLAASFVDAKGKSWPVLVVLRSKLKRRHWACSTCSM